MKKRVLLSLSILFVFPFFSIAQKSPLTAYIPENAQLVMHLNLANLEKKLSWEEITHLDFFEKMLHKADETTKNLVLNPSETGIDFSSGLYLVATERINDPNQEGIGFLMLGSLADPARFTGLLKKNLDKKQLLTAADLSFIADREFSLAWNKNTFILFAPKGLMKYGGKKGDKKLSKKEIAELSSQVKSVMTPSPNNFYLRDPRFQQLEKLNGDISIWSTGELSSLKKMKNNPFANLNLRLFTKSNYKGASVHFENGRIRCENINWVNDSMAKLMTGIYDRPMMSSLITRLPAGKPMILANVHMNPMGLANFIHQAGLKAVFDSLFKDGKISYADIAGAINGDFMLAIHQPEIPLKKAVSEEDPGPFDGLQLYLTASVRDQKKMDKLVALIESEIAKAKKEKEVVIPIEDEEGNVIEERVVTRPSPLGKSKPVFRTENGLFVLSLSNEDLEAYGAPNNNPVTAALSAEFAEFPMLLQIDLKTLGQYVMSMEMKKGKGETGETMTKIFDRFGSFYLYGGKVENNAIYSTMELRFSNKEENSLKQILGFIDEIGNELFNEARMKPAPDLEEMYSDTLAPPPPPPPHPPRLRKEGVKDTVITRVDYEAYSAAQLDETPYFPGKEAAWTKFLRENLNPIVPVENGAPAGTYHILIEILLDAEGRALDYTPKTSYGYGMEAEAIRVLKKVEKWVPGKKDGNTVGAIHLQSFTLVIMEQ